jgi:adenosine kinase
MFGGEELTDFIDKASWVTVNDYELQLMQERTGLSPHEISERVEALVVTLGSKGSHIYTEDQRIDVPAAPVSVLNDPTGCGDAYRAGLLYGLMNRLEWETTGRIAALMGAIKIEHHGTQNHRFTAEAFVSRYFDSFGSECPLC